MPRRIGSYALLHIGWFHLLVNAYAIWILAPQLELTFGSNVTLGLFSATALAGGAASALWGFQTGNAHLAAGASGGIFGLFGATVGLADLADLWRVGRLRPRGRRAGEERGSDRVLHRLKRASRQASAAFRPCSRARSMNARLSGEPCDSMA